MASIGENMEQLEHPYLPYDPAIPLLGIYPEKMKTQFYTKTYIWIFIGALAMKDKTGNNPHFYQLVKL